MANERVSTTKAISANAIKNNGATVLLGDADGSAVTRVMGKGGLASKGNVPTSVKDGTSADKSVSAQPFGYLGAGEYIFSNRTTKIGGIALTSPFKLRGTELKPNTRHPRTTRKISQLNTNPYTLTFNSGNTQVTFNRTTSNLDFGRDDAVTNPLTDVAGEFIFNPTGKLPSQNAGNHKYYTYSRVT